VRLTVSAVKRPYGGVETFIGIVEDVTPQRRLEEELTANRKSLEELAARCGPFPPPGA
jgi:signal transduction histidine kinase